MTTEQADRMPTYVDDAIAAVCGEMEGQPPELVRLYALLALTKGTETTLEDVHDAWAAWRLETRPDHPAIIPFEQLAPEIKELDRPYVEAIHRAAAAIGRARVSATVFELPPGGRWEFISFMGRIELTGYVTEVTIGGEPGFHIDKPERVWGGNDLAWEEYSARVLFGRYPVSEDSVRKAWEAQREAVERRRQREAEWARQAAQRALEAGDGTAEGGDAWTDDTEDGLDREMTAGPF